MSRFNGLSIAFSSLMPQCTAQRLSMGLTLSRTARPRKRSRPRRSETMIGGAGISGIVSAIA